MLKKTFTRIDRGMAFIEDWTLFLTVAVALCSAMANVLLRKLTSDVNLYWSDEVVRKVIFISTYIGSVSAIRHRSLIRIDALPQLVPILKKPLTIFSHLVVLLFSGIVFWFGLELTKMMYADAYAKTATLSIPEWYFYAVLPLMGVMMLIRTVLVLVEDLRGGGTPS